LFETPNYGILETEIMSIEKRIDTGLQVAGSSSEELGDVLGGIGQISEQVREIAGENMGDQAAKDDTKSVVTPTKREHKSLWGQISGLLHGDKPATLPSINAQKSQVEKSIRKETKRLIRKARQIQSQKNFSASNLEKVVVEIRYLQELLKEVLSAVKERIEALYRQFVLR